MYFLFLQYTSSLQVIKVDFFSSSFNQCYRSSYWKKLFVKCKDIALKTDSFSFYESIINTFCSVLILKLLDTVLSLLNLHTKLFSLFYCLHFPHYLHYHSYFLLMSSQ